MTQMPSKTPDLIRELENEAEALFSDGKYLESRAVLEKAMSHPMPLVRRLYLLRNIVLTYDKQGDRANALKVAHDALRQIESEDLGHTSDAGAALRGWFDGTISRYEGTWWKMAVAWGPSLAAPGLGAAASTLLIWAYGLAPVPTTVIGAFTGFFLFMRRLAPAQAAAFVLAVLSWSWTLYFLSGYGSATLKPVVIALAVLAALLGLRVMAMSGRAGI